MWLQFGSNVITKQLFERKPAIKYVNSKGEGVGQDKRVDLLFLWRHSIVLNVQGGRGVWKSPSLSVRTLWMIQRRTFEEIKKKQER